MPEVLAGIDEAAIQNWLVSEGDSVSVGQPLAEIETEKAVAEYESEIEGVVARILVSAGEDVSVGTPILAIGDDTDDASRVDAALELEVRTEPTGSSAQSASSVRPDPEAPKTEPLQPASSARYAGPRVFASPLVRRLAVQNDVDVSEIQGTGPGGRVVRRDMERFLAASEGSETPSSNSDDQGERTDSDPTEQSDEFTDVPNDRMRRAIARRLTESKSTIPHFYLSAECRMDELLELRSKINAIATRKVSVNDLIVKAVAAAFEEVPDANAIWNGDTIRRYSSVDISVAVATDGGLVTPVVKSVDKLSISQIGLVVGDLADRARSGGLKQHEIVGGSFAVSNLGMYGTREFTAILNPPQSGILAVGAAEQRAIVVEDGSVEAHRMMTVTLSADHRVIDGALAAKWMAAFKQHIENPMSILL
ncbi:dihydrolipoamide acetyltransferase family protein [Brevibacterium sp. UCMA 11754]|uniref:dihydrolipoamide acetyltransferase family protein n=1 Tax=Brevibacterium sp. UCMA 11754 TaxID=2749198 RepID=UPI001F484579|nr:dihydrolipoamide acetyltransferase family protein [Brevibacterium sp. UCMA 11754]